MSQPFVGEIRMVGFNFAPQGWALCNGQLMAISENETLFNLIGTTYGGDGQSTFALPNLQSRVPVHMGQGYTIGQTSGVEQVTLTLNQIPSHNHVPMCNAANGTSGDPANNFWAAQPAMTAFAAPGSATTAMNGGIVGQAGGNQPHDNMMPYQVVNFIISLFGIFPTQA
jgi:microcystin-dependent protein